MYGPMYTVVQLGLLREGGGANTCRGDLKFKKINGELCILYSYRIEKVCPKRRYIRLRVARMIFCIEILYS